MNTSFKRSAPGITLLVVMLFAVSPVQAQQRRHRITVPSQLPSVLYDFARGGTRRVAGGLVADAVLSRVYSQKRGYYGNRFLPAYLRARRAY
jgi:hypothetical protein